jgi:hypothetical protein
MGTPGDLCNFVVARQYSIVKELGDLSVTSTRHIYAMLCDAC